MPRIFVLLFIALGSLLSACSAEKFEDVSKAPEFKHVLGIQYEIVGAVEAYGIREHSKAEVKYITLIPPPGIEGSEVAFNIPVEIGSRIIVLKVLRSNRWPDPNLTYIVQLEGTQLPIDATIRLDLFRGNEGIGHVQLNPNIYRQQPKDTQTGITPKLGGISVFWSAANTR